MKLFISDGEDQTEDIAVTESILSKQSLSVVMPAYNEGETIYTNLIETIRTLDTFGMEYEIIAVNDGSMDNTTEMISKVASVHPQVLLVTYTKNGGKGNAIREGVRFAKNDLVAFLDSDLELHPRQLRHFIEEIETTGADVVIGSKRHPDSIVRNYPERRVRLSKGYSLLVKVLFGMHLTDTQPGLKLFKRKVLVREYPKITVKRYAFDLEILYNAMSDGYKVVEVPLEINFSRVDGGRIGFHSVMCMFRDTMGIFYRAKITRYYNKKDQEWLQANGSLDHEVRPIGAINDK